MKKILLLGGSRYLLPVIKSAHELGLYVITCDYLPDNIAHKYSDEYVNVSIIDKEAVLKTAIEKKIDGIMSFATDPGVVTAAYVAEKWAYLRVVLMRLFLFSKTRGDLETSYQIMGLMCLMQEAMPVLKKPYRILTTLIGLLL